MQKRLRSIYIAVILMVGICGCVQTAEDTRVTEIEIVKTENTDAADAETVIDENNPIAETETAENENAESGSESDTVYLKPCNTYQDVLDNAYEVIVAGRGADIISNDEAFSFNGISEALIGRDTDEALAHIGYVFYDVDGNGTEELIIADMLDGDGGPWDNRILLMYSLADDKPALLIDGWARNRYYLLNDGTIYHEGSSGAAYSVFATFRMAEDGISLEVIDYYSSGYYGDSKWGWFHSTTGVTTEDESERIEFEDENVPWQMQRDYMAQVKELDLTFFEEKNWETVTDNTQFNTEKFYRIAEEDCGLSHGQARSWFDNVTEDDIFDGGVREISDIIFDDIDGNGMTDMVIMVQEPQMESMPGMGHCIFI